jgi:hypothetical protein
MSGPSASEFEPAVRGCLEACQRCEVLVEIVGRHDAAVASRAYRAIGRHLRHCLDHLLCLTRGLDSGVVDYDARDRDERMEIDPRHFLEALRSVKGRLRAMEPAVLRRSLTLRQESAPGHRSEMGSNVERELVFLSGHTIHHLAIMMLLAGNEGVNVPEELAMAFSTASYLAGETVATSGLGHA